MTVAGGEKELHSGGLEGHGGREVNGLKRGPYEELLYNERNYCTLLLTRLQHYGEDAKR